MPRDSRVYLEDILTAAGRIKTYVAGLTRESLAQDTKTVDAVVRNLEIIGEAVKKLPADMRGRAPDVEWQKIAGLREPRGSHLPAGTRAAPFRHSELQVEASGSENAR